jgi:hypothetical protein
MFWRLLHRAADLLQINEALFRSRYSNETHLLPESKAPISERLQLVHYDEEQQYTVSAVPYCYSLAYSSSSLLTIIVME